MPPPAPRPRAEPGPLGSARDPSFELWATKHVPACEATLVVAKKKLDVLREWLAGWDAPRRDPARSRVLLIVGPPGSGKSAAVRFVARAGRGVHEWRAPVPTLWDEHKHANAFADGVAGSLAPAYSSKSTLHRRRAEGVRCAPLACVAGAGAGPSAENVRSASGEHGDGRHDDARHGGATSISKEPKQPLLLVEDLPVGGGEDQHRRALELLVRLAREARVPAVVAVSEEDAGGVGLSSNPAGGGGGAGAGATRPAAGTEKPSKPSGRDSTARRIVAAMESAGAATVALNQPTTPKLVKALAAVAAAERVDVDDAGLAAIAAAAGRGRALRAREPADVRRRALRGAGRAGLFARGGQAQAREQEAQGARRRAARRRDGGATTTPKTHPRDAAAAEAARRDRGLSVFHALGKILYNKRDDGSAIIRDGNGEDATETNGSFRDPSAPFSSGVPARGADGALWFGSAVLAFPSTRTHRRARTKYASPETILARARFGADRATTFLFENFPEGPARRRRRGRGGAGATYLSDAAWFASAGRAPLSRGSRSAEAVFADANANGTLTDGNGAPADPGAVGELVAGSVATRGLLFAHLSRPPLRGFRAFKGPQSGRRTAPPSPTCGKCARWSPPPPAGTSPSARTAPPPPPRRCPCLRVIAGAGAEGAERVPYLPTRWVRAARIRRRRAASGASPGTRVREARGAGRRRRGPGLGAGRARAGDEDEEEQEEGTSRTQMTFSRAVLSYSTYLRST